MKVRDMDTKKALWLGGLAGAAVGMVCASIGWAVHEAIDMIGFGAYMADVGQEGCRCKCREEGKDEDTREDDKDGCPAGAPVMVICMGGFRPADPAKADAGDDTETAPDSDEDAVDVPDGEDDPARVAWI